jgi:hypothetical protein
VYLWVLSGKRSEERHRGDIVAIFTSRLKQHRLAPGFGEIAGERTPPAPEPTTLCSTVLFGPTSTADALGFSLLREHLIFIVKPTNRLATLTHMNPLRENSLAARARLELDEAPIGLC